MSIRTHRHVPWLLWCSFFLLALAGGLVAVILSVVADPAVDTVSKAVFGIFLIVVSALFPLGSFRVRTVIDDEAVTQHWITRSYRIPLDEITGLEIDDDGSHRWFVRVFQGEKTFEVIPCPVMFRPRGAFFPRPPKAVVAVLTDLEESVAGESV